MYFEPPTGFQGRRDVTASRPSQKTPVPKGELGRLRIW
jgi:hypothetical protein